MSATVKITVKIPAIRHSTGQFDRAEKYSTEVAVLPGTEGRVRIGDYEFLPEDLVAAMEIMQKHNAL